jgi:anion-transporting  ArsA/GET3 family ATPase
MALLDPTFVRTLTRPMIFISGKGGVGKTTLSKSIAQILAAKGKRTLWACFEDPLLPPGDLKNPSPNLWEFNCHAVPAFEEYARMRLRLGPLVSLFLKNRLIRYLAQTVPGIHEIVLLGKVWHERLNYDHVVIDLPSTGHGLAMFQSALNFKKLFRGSPIQKDSESIIATFSDSEQSAFIIVSLPEEMPLQESLELKDLMLNLFPDNPPAFVVNKMFPELRQIDTRENAAKNTAEDYLYSRHKLEKENLKLWEALNLPYSTLEWALSDQPIVPQLTLQITNELKLPRSK